MNEETGTPPSEWTTDKKIQYYLDIMGFQTGGVDGIFGVKSSSSLIILQYYLNGNITGVPDDTSLNSVIAAANNGTICSTIDSYLQNWVKGTPSVTRSTQYNGQLPQNVLNTLVRIPGAGIAADSDATNVENQTATTWAKMVWDAMKTSLDVNKFASKGSSAGYRTYHKQVEAYMAFRCGGNRAYCPYFSKGRTYQETLSNQASETNANNSFAENWITNNVASLDSDGNWNNVPDSATEAGEDLEGYGGSNHGWGLALDMKLDWSDEERTWLVARSSTYGFSEINSESWHFDYN